MIGARLPQVWSEESRTRRGLPEMWHQMAVVSLTFALVDGYGAYTQLFPITPLKYVALQITMLVATLLVCPRGSLTKVFVPIPTVLFLGWWILSYLWDTNHAGWVSVSSRDLTTIVAIVALSQIVGADEFIRSLLRSGYISIGLIFVALIVQPGLAYDVAGPSPGLHGAFVHKNEMAPCLLVTAAAVLCFHPRQAFRRWFVAFIGLLMYLGQTTTGLATLAALVILHSVLTNYTKIVNRLGRAAGSLLFGATVLATIVLSQSFAAVVRLSGKDLTFSSRTLIWSGVVDAIRQRPLLGFGYGVWQNIFVDPILSINLRNGFLVAEAHDAALDLLLRLGIVGLGLYLLQLANTVRVGWQGQLRDDPFGTMTLLFCVVVVLVGFSESLTAYALWPALLIVFAATNHAPRSAPPRSRLGARRAANSAPTT